MSGRRPWIRFERRGGQPPRDDEELRLGDDGAFTARRTIGGARIGLFAGELSRPALGRLRTALEAVATAGDVTLPTPREGATETLEAAGWTVRLGSNATPPTPWRALIERVRKLLQDEVVDSPRAAIELRADARTARLVHTGEEPIEIDLGSVTVQVVHLAADGGVLARWNGRATASLVDNGERLVPAQAWVTAGPGWSAALPFDHGQTIAAGDRLQVWVQLSIRSGDQERAGRLYVPVLRDG